MKSQSLRKQLAIAIIASLAVLGIIGNGLMFAYIKHLDIKKFDDELEREMNQLAAMLVLEPEGHFKFEAHDLDLPDFRVSENADYYQVWMSETTPMVFSPSLKGATLPFEETTLEEHIIKDLILPDGRKGRAIWKTVIARPEQPELLPTPFDPSDPENRAHLVFASSREELDKILSLELLCASLIGGAMILGAVVIVNWLTSRAFEKVKVLSDAMGEIGMGTLSSRVPDSELPLELQPVALQFNEVLARLEKDVQREKRFSADIAHELRTPLTALLSLHELAVDEAKDGSLEDPGAYSEDALSLTLRIHTLIETLSHLHDVGLEHQELAWEKIALQSLLKPVWEECKQEIASRAITCKWDELNNAELTTDATLAYAMFYNLLNNAITHAPPGSCIECVIDDMGSHVGVGIFNLAPDLEQGDLDHLTEAFWQKDLSRTDIKHVGLGLTLVMVYAGLLQAEVEYELSNKGRFKVHVVLPKNPRLRNSLDSQRIWG